MIPSPSPLVRDAFDGIAADFDATYENDTTRRLRSSLYAMIAEAVPPGSAILDLSCGTGIDCLALHGMGYTIALIDIAPGMVRVAREKLDAGRIPHRAFVCPMEEAWKTIPGPFDLVLSNFGAVNCLPDLPPLERSVASLLKPGGFFLVVAMPVVSPWEILSGIIRGNAHGAFRRFRAGTTATGFGPNAFGVHYHSLASLRGTFASRFDVERVTGWNIISPPPHADNFRRRFPRLTTLLIAAERRLASLPVIRASGDHIMLLLRKKQDAAGRSAE